MIALHEVTGAVATLFAPFGDDFIRVSTYKTFRESVLLLLLTGRDHPGYNKLKNGQSYYAQVQLFGQRYVTYYLLTEFSRQRLTVFLFY
ncbi:Cache 3/Cache 2 fusion domain-containing protein [Vibrio lentus]|nr:Cache 3/Cache 2 fusion domain-containing protein [Vibrio lentus]